MKQAIFIIILFFVLTVSVEARWQPYYYQSNAAAEIVNQFNNPHQLICNSTAMVGLPAGCGPVYGDWHYTYRPYVYAQLQAPIPPVPLFSPRYVTYTYPYYYDYSHDYYYPGKPSVVHNINSWMYDVLY